VCSSDLARAGERPEATDILDRLLATNTDFEERAEAQQLHSTLTN